jgi:uncharacterized membrane protein
MFSGDNTSMTTQLNPGLRYGASISLICLIVLCVAWELWLAPLRPGGSWLVLKVIPLLFPLRGVLKGNLYTLQWAAMLILLYFMEGVVRAWSDPHSMWVIMACIEIVLSTIFYVCAIMYLRPAKRAAKQRAALAARNQEAGPL